MSKLYLFINILVFQFMNSCLSIAGEGKLEYIVVNHPWYNPGMFSVFNTVAGFLDLYENGDYAGLEIDFEEKGLYYDPTHGKNWWNYYCQPIKLGSSRKAKIKHYGGDECGERAWHTEKSLSRERVFELVEKYIKFSKFITNKVDKFVEKHFEGKYVIGVHYRGTDKKAEAPRVPYDGVIYLIQKRIKDIKVKNYKIFVATDEEDFLEHIKLAFPLRVAYIPAKRSKDGNPIHFDCSSHNYEKGEQAIMDTLLLSKTHYLIRTSSNLSLWSTYLNPSLEVHLINKRFIP